MLPKIRQIGFNIMFFEDKNVQKGEITNNVLAAVLWGTFPNFLLQVQNSLL